MRLVCLELGSIKKPTSPKMKPVFSFWNLNSNNVDVHQTNAGVGIRTQAWGDWPAPLSPYCLLHTAYSLLNQRNL